MAWKRFAQAFNDNNPYSNDDNELREKTESQINYWRNEAKRLDRENLEAEQKRLSEIKRQEASNTGNYTESLTGTEMVFVQGGCYQMGQTLGYGFRDDDEKPVHEVCVDDFYIGKYEVTQGEWKRIMGSNPSFFLNGDNYPVEQVSWDDTQEFIKNLNRETGKKYRLPTEAEWEYAARCRGENVRFGTGKNIISADEANYDEIIKHKKWYSLKVKYTGKYRKKTVPSKSFQPNVLGLYNMSGNVWEWVEDIYSKEAYKKHQRNNPIYTGYTENGSFRVFRGGSWYCRHDSLRASNRYNGTPDYRNNDLGFRLARTP